MITRFALALMFISLAALQGQTPPINEVLEGRTPPGMAPGSPAGSYILSGFDTVDQYSGHLNFRLPLLQIGGRGEVKYALTLVIPQTPWHVAGGIAVFPSDVGWNPEIRYSTGQLIGRYGKYSDFCFEDLGGARKGVHYSLTRLTFIAPDGTETELRDQAYGGKPGGYDEAYHCLVTPTNRGSIFVTADGTSMTFVSDTPIIDDLTYCEIDCSDLDRFYPAGRLMLRDGTTYRIDNGVVSWIRDRNGNRITFTHDPLGNLISATDPLNRTVTISYGNSYGNPDVITFKGFEDPLHNRPDRTIRVFFGNSVDLLRPGYTGKGVGELFAGSFSSITFPTDPYSRGWVPSAVELPNHKSYSFQYNSYGELAAVTLPTGGRIEYDITGPSGLESDSGVTSGEGFIHRRLVRRRTYAPGSSTEEGRTEYSVAIEGTPEMYYSNGLLVQANYYDRVADGGQNPSGLLARSEKHHFYGNPESDAWSSNPTGYSPFKQGREYLTEEMSASGALLRSVTTTWWQAAPPAWYPPSDPVNTAPANNPYVVNEQTTLADTGQTSTRVYLYDQYNNVREVVEYGFDGGVVRQRIMQYKTDGYDTDLNVHQRSLILQETIKDAAGNIASQTTYEYDAGSLTGYNDISGHEVTLSGGFGTSYTTRGNATRMTRLLRTPGVQADSTVETSMSYDIAGNVTAITDANGKTTDFDYTDSFEGATDLNSGQHAYAFAKFTTLPPAQDGKPRFSVMRTYDYDTGSVYEQQDINGVLNRFLRNDDLDRLTSITLAVGTSAEAQTAFGYDDTNRVVTTNRQLDGQRWLTTAAVFDGSGRVTEQRTYESASAYVAVRTVYDGLNRVWRVSNPSRTTQFEWTTNTYDALNRLLTVTMPDGAVSTNQYTGNQTTLTDPANVKRQDTTDALGRLTQVVENPGVTPSYTTTYSYDALDNLTGVNQSGQTRTFQYDSLKRLHEAQNPESGAATYSYDGNGNLIGRRDVRNVTTTIAYDALNRVRSKTYSDGTPPVLYCYDGETANSSITCGAEAGPADPVKGRLTGVGNNLSRTAFLNYTPTGLIGSSRQTTNGTDFLFGYGYNLAGSLTSMSYPSGRSLSIEQDNAGRTGRVTGTYGSQSTTYAEGQTPGAWIEYAAHGTISGARLGNSKFEEICYNNRLQPKGIRVGVATTSGTCIDPGTDSFNLTLDYGAPTANNGNLMSQRIASGGLPAAVWQHYTYDAFNRLDTADEPGGSGGSNWRRVFRYDAFGNVWVETAAGVTADSFTPTTEDWFARDAGGVKTNRLAPMGLGIAYDGGGSLTAIGAYLFEYDAENRLKKSTINSVPTVFSYDGEGRRVQKITCSAGTDPCTLGSPGASVTTYVYDASGNLASEYATQAASSVKCNTCYLTADHLGSTRMMADENGAVKSLHDFLPFGEEIPAGTGGRSASYYPAGTLDINDAVAQKFTGKERDGETSLDWFGQRYLSNAQGRFTSPDKPFVDQHAEDPQSWSLYAYARNNPLKLIDVQGNAAQNPKPVPDVPGYTYRLHLNNQNDNPNFHIYNRKDEQIGRISVREVPTGIDPKTGRQLTGLGYEVEGNVPWPVRKAIQSIVNEEGIKPRFAMRGGPFKGFTVAGVGALAIADVLIQAVDLAVQTNRTGIGVNMAPWNYGSLYIADLQKAAATLGNGTYIEYTNKKGNTTIYQVQDGRFVKPKCNGKDCELTDENSGNMFHVIGVM